MANINVIGKTVAAAATPEVLGASVQRFKNVLFYGGKGTAETSNTGTAYVQLKQMAADGTAGEDLSAMPVTKGGYSAGLTAPDGQWFSADQFTIKVGTNGDGVVAIVGG